ncbi:hypothetical protein AAIB33_14415 [Microbacterium sp. AZCO]|uniref:hypothetical protein n=1 Tax=Microbacterium sp. AZCO TaxID=3142976 RepID=UPI0031F3B714
MKHLGRALACAAAAAVLVTAPLIAAPAMADQGAAPPTAAETKVVVCKYITTPGEGEVLQTGQNPIEVSVNALGDGFAGAFPYVFTDAQVKSIAIGWVGAGLGITDCPGYRPPQPENQPLSDSRTTSTCTQPLDGTRTEIVGARTGTRTYVWDGDSWEPQDSWGEWTVTSTKVTPDPACAPDTVPVPALFSVAPQPPTCGSDGSLPALVTLEHVTLTWDRPFDGPGTYTLTATATDGYTFADGTTVKTKEFTVAAALGYQSDAPDAPCFREEQTPPPAGETPGTPTPGTTTGTPTGTTPGTTTGTPTGTSTATTTGTTRASTTAASTGSDLATTGSRGVSPLVPVGGAVVLLIGIAATAYAALHRRA